MFGAFDTARSDQGTAISPVSSGVPDTFLSYARDNHKVVGEVIQDGIEVVKIVGAVFACAAIGHSVLKGLNGLR